jgi:NADH:ubiquinone oxidoreductase subunit 3 (subunit A)
MKMDILLSPPLAFPIYIILVSVLAAAGRHMAGASRPSRMKSTTYSSGETPPEYLATPGYQSFFRIALFFAIIHLGILVIGTSQLTPLTGVYLVGLLGVLLALILG